MEPPSIRVLSPRLDAERSPPSLINGLIVLGEWKGQTMAELLPGVKSLLGQCRLDLETTQPCYTPEEAKASAFRMDVQNLSPAGSINFDHRYQIWSCEHLGMKHEGNKVMFPTSALRQLSKDGHRQLPNPLLFEVSSKLVKTHVGGKRLTSVFAVFTLFLVWEFSAEEGQVVAPKWVLRNLRVNEGETVRFRVVSLPKGNFLRLQPNTKKFLKINGNDRVKVVAMLEYQMPKFAAFTMGDTVRPLLKMKLRFSFVFLFCFFLFFFKIEIVHDGEHFGFFVMESRPSAAVTCIAEPFLGKRERNTVDQLAKYYDFLKIWKSILFLRWTGRKAAKLFQTKISKILALQQNWVWA